MNREAILEIAYIASLTTAKCVSHIDSVVHVAEGIQKCVEVLRKERSANEMRRLLPVDRAEPVTNPTCVDVGPLYMFPLFKRVVIDCNDIWDVMSGSPITLGDTLLIPEGHAFDASLVADFFPERMKNSVMILRGESRNTLSLELSCLPGSDRTMGSIVLADEPFNVGAIQIILLPPRRSVGTRIVLTKSAPVLEIMEPSKNTRRIVWIRQPKKLLQRR